MGHIKMMGAVQPFLSGAISKTVNMPHEATVEDIADAYLQAWRLGVKALAIYRDGSKTAQALRTERQDAKPVASVDDAKAAAEALGERLYSETEVEALLTKARAEVGTRRRMPRERQSLTHKFSVGGHEGYVTAGMYEDGTRRRDLPHRHRQGGLDAAGDDELLRDGDLHRAAVRRAARDARAEVRLHALRARGDHAEPEIPFAKSMPDYIMRWLASRFLDADTQEELGILTPEVRARKMAEDAARRAGADTAGPANGGGDGGNGGARPTPRRPPPTAPGERAGGARRRRGPAAAAPDRRADRDPAGRPGPPVRPRPRAGLQPVRRDDAADGLLLHVLVLREHDGLRLTRRPRHSASEGPREGPFLVRPLR